MPTAPTGSMFRWLVVATVPPTAAGLLSFSAFPLTGMQGPPGPLPGTTGDFCAYSSSATIPTPAAVVIPSTILTGNSGNWYSTSTGRYTPPAGRYFIRASTYVPSASAAVGLQVNIRKNGVNIPGAGGGQVPGTAGWWGDPAQAVIVDANGTDYFDMVAYAGPAQTGAIQFMAFNIAGVVGPQGPAGPPGVAGGQIIRDIILAVPAPTIDLFNLGPTYKTIKVLYRLMPVTDAVGVYLRGTNGSTPDLSSNYYSLMMYGFGASSVGYVPQSAVSAFIFTTSQSNIAGTATAGSIEFPDLAGSVGEAAYYYAQGGGGTPVTAKTTCLKLASAAHNGLQFSLSAGNFAAGSYVRVIGWP